MAQKTTLSTIATPTRTYGSFTGKSEVAGIQGAITASFAVKAPSGTFSVKAPSATVTSKQPTLTATVEE